MVMTFGEMQAWTERFNNIMTAPSTRALRNARLTSLAYDIRQAYDITENKFAGQLHETIAEELD